MGRRGGGSARRQSILSAATIHRRIKSSKLSHLSSDEIAEHLYSSYPDYKHFKFLPFRTKITQLLFSSPRPETDTDSPISRKKPRKNHDSDSEQRLIDREAQHLKRRRSSEVSSSSASATSEDTDTPKFDFLKSSLRSGYAKSEENVEVEDVRAEKKLGSAVASTTGSGGEVVEHGKGEAKGKEKRGIRFKDFGGIKKIIDELITEVIVPFYHPELPRWLGVKPITGILLHGPPGCGKTRLAQAIANETDLPFYQISATEIVSGVSGASEENIRELFSKAHETAPSIVFIDEIDAIASKRENLQREMERRIVTQLLTCMDESHTMVKKNDKDTDKGADDKKSGYVLVIGATNRPDAVDAALRRPGRFDKEIPLGVPDENARAEILSVLTEGLRLAGDFDLIKIAKATPGFVGADLVALANTAGNLAMKRISDKRWPELPRMEGWWKEPWAPEDMKDISIIMTDFEEAAKLVQPSSKREGFSTIPDVRWDDVGGLAELRKQFELYIVNRIKYPTLYEESGVDLETGFMLYGPPGCGKTLIAKAVACEAGANFIHIKGPELLNKYVGESELHVRNIFRRARTCAPCIIFFDEIDALTTERGKEGGWVVERLLNQLLIELNGGDHRRGVYVIGATNRPEVIDHALLRPGRFGKLLFVPLPNAIERGLILKANDRKKLIDESVNLLEVGERCENMSGADLSALVNEAAMALLQDNLKSTGSGGTHSSNIKPVHFEQALKKVKPSVSDKQRAHYEKLSQTFGTA